MVFSLLQFMTAILLSIAFTQSLILSGNEINILCLVIPALWLFPRSLSGSLLLCCGLLVYALTLTIQPVSVSVAMWILFPLLMVSFSKKSNLVVVCTVALIVATLIVGLMVSQSAGRLEGTPGATLAQMVAICALWCSARYWQPTHIHWWSALLFAFVWISGFTYNVLAALSLIGIMTLAQSLSRDKLLNWMTLLCWTLPSVGFATIVLSSSYEVPSAVFVVWLCLLATAWVTDYILNSESSQENV